MSWVGWAYELKTASVEMIKKRVARTGDGTRKLDDGEGATDGHEHVTHGGDVWGWGDKSMKVEDIQDATIYNQLVQ